ncbi:MAG: queuosine 5'-phosphate N-glycosylase/hydrolase [Thermomicrobiales bacterium]
MAMVTALNNLDLTLEQPDAIGVLETTAPVVAAAQSVRIIPDAITRAAAALAAHGKNGKLVAPVWNKHYHWHDDRGRAVNVTLLLDALNFCFWAAPGEPRWELTYKGEALDGYWALAAALKRAIDEGDCPLWDADFLSEISAEEANDIFHPDGASSGRIPMFEARLANMREVGRVLNQHYDGWFGAAFDVAGGSTPALVRQVVERFPSFDDTTTYNGREVRLYKRAQILASDLYGAFDGNRWGNLRDLDQLTAFADYKVPQLLRAEGILDYAPELAARIAAREPLPAESQEEVEIRAATVWGVELLRRALAERGVSARPFELDWLLWTLAQDRPNMEPYHRTRTVFY